MAESGFVLSRTYAAQARFAGWAERSLPIGYRAAGMVPKLMGTSFRSFAHPTQLTTPRRIVSLDTAIYLTKIVGYFFPYLTFINS